MGHAQRTRSQRWYEDAKDPDKTLASQVDALEAVFEFVTSTYKRFRKDESNFDESYVTPSRSDLQEALINMQKRL